MTARRIAHTGLRATIAAMLGMVLLTLAIMLAMVQRADQPDPPAATERARAKALEADCRHTCSAWIVSQCDAQSAAQSESVFECASRLAPIFQDCLNRCRAR
jgi:lysylphosphatidylglycerol synthetase-like protein (DUF2156 family)